MLYIPQRWMAEWGVDAAFDAPGGLVPAHPEPPARNDPLWSLSNVIITPHIANPASGLTRELAPWIAENLRRFRAGEDLVSTVAAGHDY